jgi:hypothetical protein
MEDLYSISFEQILDYLAELGPRLDLKNNAYLQEALEYSYDTAPTTKPIMDSFYHDLPFMFDKERIRKMVDFNIGIDHLEGWVEQQLNGSTVGIRAYGSRQLHIVAGNGPVLGALTVIRGAVTARRHDHQGAVERSFTTGAIARTMVDMAPDHPLTKHLAVAYWRGGDEGLGIEDLPAAQHREDLRLGRLRLGQARHQVHPARHRANQPRPQTFGKHRRQGGAGKRGGDGGRRQPHRR